MTEQEWLACMNPEPMLEHLRGRASDRKLRLFACGCCRLFWRLYPGITRSRNAVVVSERYADGLATREELKAARKRARGGEHATVRTNAYEAAVEAARAAADEVRFLAIECSREEAIIGGHPALSAAASAATQLAGEQLVSQSALLRELFGNPFRPASVVPSWIGWHDGTVRTIAGHIYEERAFDHLPVLADALEDAGCDNADILAHCRGGGEHVRGCWVVDLLLGKS